jgi:hypothetical protein
MPAVLPENSECARLLGPARTVPLTVTFEGAWSLSVGVSAHTTLSFLQLEAEASRAKFVNYRLVGKARHVRSDTEAYEDCCTRRKTCGAGLVTALIEAAGFYRTTTDDQAGGGITVPVAGGVQGYVHASELHRRDVEGFVAAEITPRSSRLPVCPSGCDAGACLFDPHTDAGTHAYCARCVLTTADFGPKIDHGGAATAHCYGMRPSARVAARGKGGIVIPGDYWLEIMLELPDGPCPNGTRSPPCWVGDATNSPTHIHGLVNDRGRVPADGTVDVTLRSFRCLTHGVNGTCDITNYTVVVSDDELLSSGFLYRENAPLIGAGDP